MEFRILGPLQVLAGGEEVVLRSAKERALLVALLLEAGRPVSRERLIEELWGESPPATAEAALNVHVSQLRRALVQDGGATIATRAPGYAIEIEPDELDASRFERLVADARMEITRGEPEEAARLLRDALALWRGRALDGVELESVARHEAGRLNELRLAALMDRIDCDLALGLHEQLIGELDALVAEQPLLERARGQLMLALYRAGRQADALRAYRDARATLVEQLGIEPSAALQRLEKAILNQDPSLEVAAPTRSTAPTPSTRRRRAALAPLALIALALIAVAAGVALILTRGHPPVTPVAVRHDSVAVVDPRTNAVVADIPLHARPAAVAFAAHALWVATKDDHTLIEIDAHSHHVTHTFGLGAEPSAIAAEGHRVWVLFEPANTLAEFDGVTDTLARTTMLTRPITVGPFKGRPLQFSGSMRLGLVPNANLAVGAGAVWIGYGSEIVARIDTRSGAIEQIHAGSKQGLAYGAGAVWSVSDGILAPPAGTISRIDTRTRAVTTQIPPLANSTNGIYGIAAGPSGLWEIDQIEKRALNVDPGLLRVTAVVPLDHPPAFMAVGSGAVWVANNDATITRIDDRTAAVVKTIPLGQALRAGYPVGLTTGDGAAWVAVH